MNGDGGPTKYENRLYILNKNGTGDVFWLKVNASRTILLDHKIRREVWDEIKQVSDYEAVVCNNCLYILGGFDNVGKDYTNRVMRFCPDKDVWELQASMLNSRSKFAAGVIQDAIVVLGGEKSPGRSLAASEMFNVKTNTWTRTGILPDARHNHRNAVINGVLYTSGGKCNDQPEDNIWCFDRLARVNWQDLDEDYPQYLTKPIHKHNMVAVKKRLYFIGGNREKFYKDGRQETITLNTIQSFQPHVPLTDVLDKTRPNVQVPDFPRDRDGQPPSEDEDEERPLQADIISPWEFNEGMQPMKYGRHSAGAAVLGNRIYLFGGSCIGSNSEVRQVEYYDVEKRTWNESFTIKKGDLRNVVCVFLKIPVIPPSEQAFQLHVENANKHLLQPGKWIMW